VGDKSLDTITPRSRWDCTTGRTTPWTDNIVSNNVFYFIAAHPVIKQNFSASRPFQLF